MDFSGLALEAVGGSKSALNELWELLVPVAQGIAKCACARGRCSRSNVDDVAQEILLAVPRMVVTLRAKITEQHFDRDVTGWIVKALNYESLKVCERMRTMDMVSLHTGGKDGQPIDANNYKYEPADSTTCVKCEAELTPLSLERGRVHCGKCFLNFRRTIIAVNATVEDCRQLLTALRQGAVIEKGNKRSLAILRVAGYGLAFDKQTTTVRLTSTPDDSKSFERQIGKAFLSSGAKLSCWCCNEEFKFQVVNANNYCSVRCNLRVKENHERRQSKVQAQPSSSGKSGPRRGGSSGKALRGVRDDDRQTKHQKTKQEPRPKPTKPTA